jgi:hypothetical protein
MKLKRICGVCIGLVVFFAVAAAFGQEAPGQEPPGAAMQNSIDNAVKKGCEYLKSQQMADGSWDYIDKPFSLPPLVESHLVEGCTALCLYALLKGGESPKSPAIEKGFAFIRSRPFRHVYSVSCYVLALSALYTEEEVEVKRGEEVSQAEKVRTVVREEAAKEFGKKATPQDKKLVTDAIEWLLNQQKANVWRYPEHGEDASNTQYVMLAFNEARRLKICQIPPDRCMKVAEYFLKYQEKSGPEVEWFPVPGADLTIREMQKAEKELKKEIGKVDKELEKSKDKIRADEVTTTVVDDARKKMFGGEKKKMFARGWCYMPNDPEKEKWRAEITGSMTTSGIIALTVCKSILEGTPQYTADFAARVDQGIRDGCAWIAKKFSVSTNPTGSGESYIHHYYYLYGLERAGALTLATNFGTNDWYKDGTQLIISQQHEDGNWQSPRGTGGPVIDTCFAILFLKRATTPIVNVPPPPLYTGTQLTDPNKK